jgi:hypothetical protein
MLTALFGALGDILRVAVVALERFALLLERTPLGPFWPVAFVVLFQALAFVLSVFVWVWRGRVWPVACDYPRTTTRGRKPCHNRVLGEWSRCHLHRRRWRRATDSHEVDPTLRRWETIHRGVKVERTDLGGSGFIRRQSKGIGILYRKGFARPPRDVLRLAPQLARDYRQRFAELYAGFQHWRRRTGGGEEQQKYAGASSLVPAVIYCTQFVLLVLAIALVLVAVAVLFRLLQPRYVSARVVVEYGAAFFFLAAAAFRSGILGRRVKPRVWEPEEEWLRQARKEATATFFVMMAVAWAYAAFNAVKSEIPGWLVAIAFLFMLASDSGKKPRRRRRAAW